MGGYRRAGGLSLQHDSRLLRTPDRMAAHADRAPLQPRRAGRVPVPRARRHLAGPHPGARDAGAAEPRGAARRLRQGPRNLHPRRLQGGRARLAGTGHPRRAARGARPGHGRHRRPPLRRARRRLQAARPDRPALPGSQHRLYRGRRRRPRHPVHPPVRGQPGAVRLRLGAAPHLDGRDRPHRRHRRRHLARQGPDQGTAVHLRRAGARRPPGRQRGRRLGGGRGHRPAGGRETL